MKTLKSNGYQLNSAIGLSKKVRIIQTVGFAGIALILFISIFSENLFAHGGEDHGEKKEAKNTGKAYFTVYSVSDAFQVVLRYTPLKANEKATMKLFISDAGTNAPVQNAKVEIISLDDASLKFEVKIIEAGIYSVEGSFPADSSYTLVANIATNNKADLMTLEKIKVGQDVPHEHEGAVWFGVNSLIFLVFGIALGGGTVFYVGRKRQNHSEKEETV